MATKKANLPKIPPKESVRSLQFDLFGQFIASDTAEVSNTIDVWESIPKYFLNNKQQLKLRTAEGLAKPFSWSYQYNGVPCMVKIQPALIEQKNGGYKAFFPSVTEELVEEALKKILSDQRYGIHDVEKGETWVRFTLGMIYRELKARGRTRDRNQIKHAIEVMSKSILSLFHDSKEVWSGAILQDLVTVDRDEYIADTDAHHIARLPLFVSHAINTLEYRQYNYDRFMSCDEPLARLIYKRLINRFKRASLSDNYHFLFSDLKGSGLLQQSKERGNREKVISALNELVERSVLSHFDTEERKEGRAVTDVQYILYPSAAFVDEQNEANQRAALLKTSTQSLSKK